jgi:uncharacterized protein YuzE
VKLFISIQQNNVVLKTERAEDKIRKDWNQNEEV